MALENSYVKTTEDHHNGNLPLPTITEYQSLFPQKALASSNSDLIDFASSPDIYKSDETAQNKKYVHRYTSDQVITKDPGLAGDTVTTAPIEINEKIAPGVSKPFKTSTEEWVHNKIPRHIQQLMHDHDIGITIYANANQVPKNIREQHARRHPADENYGNLNMFYDPSSHSLIFIENPDKLQGKQQQTGETVQNFQFGPNEETAFHELGHAMDYQVLNLLSHSKEFDDAFRTDRDKLTAAEKQSVSYFVKTDLTQPKRHQDDGAKEELLAQIFAALNTPPYKRGTDSRRVLSLFDDVVKVILKHKNQLLGDTPINF